MEDIEPVGMNPVGLKDDDGIGIPTEMVLKIITELTEEDMLSDAMDDLLTEPLAEPLTDPLATTEELSPAHVYTLVKLGGVRHTP